MLYYLFTYLNKNYSIPGAGVFQYITFRAFAATVTSLGLAAIFGKKVINLLQKLQIGNHTHCQSNLFHRPFLQKQYSLLSF